MMTTPHPIETGYASVVEPELAALDALCRRFRVRRLDLFGSAVGERFDAARSDIDLLVEFEPMPPGGLCLRLFWSCARRWRPSFSRCRPCHRAGAEKSLSAANVSSRRSYHPLFRCMISGRSRQDIFTTPQSRRSGSPVSPPDRTFDDYVADDMLRAAVERQFEIIGEAFASVSPRRPGFGRRGP